MAPGCRWLQWLLLVLKAPWAAGCHMPFPCEGSWGWAVAGEPQHPPHCRGTAKGLHRHGAVPEAGGSGRARNSTVTLVWTSGGYLGFMALEKFSGFSGISVGLQPSGFVSASYSMDLSVHWSLRIILNVWSEWSIEDAKIQLVSCFIYYSLNYCY